MLVSESAESRLCFRSVWSGIKKKKKSMSLGLVCCILKKKNPCHSLQVEDKNLGVKGGPSIFNPDQSHELLIPLFSRML